MKLPNAESAYVDLRKLRDYTLSSEHPRGRHKARVFASVLGLTAKDAERLRDVLLNATRLENALEGDDDEYGKRYSIEFLMIVGDGRRAIIRSSWIIRHEEDFPRYVTCYIVKGDNDDQTS